MDDWGIAGVQVVHAQRELHGINNLVLPNHTGTLHHVRFEHVQQGALHELGTNALVIGCRRIRQHEYNVSAKP